MEVAWSSPEVVVPLLSWVQPVPEPSAVEVAVAALVAWEAAAARQAWEVPAAQLASEVAAVPQAAVAQIWQAVLPAARGFFCDDPLGFFACERHFSCVQTGCVCHPVV